MNCDPVRRLANLASVAALTIGLLAAQVVAQAPQGQHDDHRSADAGHVTARQSTPILGVVVGKQLEGDFAEVVSVWPSSPADQAGIQQGDRIMRVGDDEVNSPEAVRNAVLKHDAGEKVAVQVMRDNKTQTYDVELGSTNRWQQDLSQLNESETRELLKELLAVSSTFADQLSGEDVLARAQLRDELTLPQTGVATLMATKGNDVKGTLLFQQNEQGLHVTGKITGLSPGSHGFHIHQYGDLRAADGTSAGGHFNPEDTQHGGPHDQEHHAGDLGNIEANSDGVAQVDIRAPWLKLHFILGRSIVVHGGKDDLQSQPSGDAGPRVALGVIGIAEGAEQQNANADSNPSR